MDYFVLLSYEEILDSSIPLRGTDKIKTVNSPDKGLVLTSRKTVLLDMI